MTSMRNRSLAKTLTWRSIATTDTFIIAWFITGEPLVGLSIVTIEIATKMALYYLHERAWARTEWGTESLQD